MSDGSSGDGDKGKREIAVMAALDELVETAVGKRDTAGEIGLIGLNGVFREHMAALELAAQNFEWRKGVCAAGEEAGK
jgi:hypothetical protein